MRKIIIPALLFAFFATGISALGMQTTGNLVANPSVETGSTSTSSIPNGWQANSWGSNSSTFSHIQNSGAEGNKSLRVETTSYTDGDAKWYFSPISVKPATDCTFSDSYKSNVVTNITIQYLMNDGSYQYTWLGNPEASVNSYKQFSKSFTTPANVKSMTVFHILSKVGWLNTDDYSLTCQSEDTTPAPQPIPTGEMVPNNSLESGSTIPDSWVSNSWGSTTANFSYLKNDGAEGTRSVRVDVTNASSTGDAKWHFQEVAVQPNQTCTFSNSYKSNVTTDVTVGYTMQDNSKQYYWLGSTAMSNSYKRFTKTFTTPANAKSITVYHVINKKGWLITDAFSLKCGTNNPTQPSEPEQPSDPVKFNRPLVSIEFDDGWKNAYDLGFPVVEEFGYRATQYVITQTPGWGGYMSDNEIRSLDARGHTIGSHTISHPHLPQLTDVQIATELKTSKDYLQNVLGKPVDLFVTPYCESDSRVRTEAMKHYAMLRNCTAATNTKQNFDAYNLGSYIVLSDTTDAEIRSWINDAKANNGWIVLVYHEVKNNPDNPWATSPSILRRQLQIVKDSGIAVKKTGDALIEVKSQL